MYSMTRLGSEKIFFDFYYVPYQKDMTSPQDNIDLKNLFGFFVFFQQMLTFVSEVLSFNLNFSSKINQP
jgi:hypothetical protein